MAENTMTLVERAAGRLRGQLLGSALRPQLTPAPPKAPVRVAPANIAEAEEHAEGRVRPFAGGGAAAVIKSRSTPTVAFNREQLKEGAIIDWSMTRGRVTEELRIIKRQLLNNAFSEGDNAQARADVIMVTSARPHEGKTFTSLNLALSIAQESNRHVLLVDADGSRQGLRRFLTAAELPGLLDLVADPAADAGDAILRTEVPRLSVVLAGTEQHQGPELLASQRMRSLIDEMAARYDDRIIILDAPPCLVSSDPAVLASIVGQVVFVIEADRTQRGEVEASLELLYACPRISLILNKTKVTASNSFGSYGYYR
jgi:protein-tyrosine kinase